VFSLDEIIDTPPFSLSSEAKGELYVRAQKHLTGEHVRKCERYRRMLEVQGFTPDAIRKVEDVPFIPVRLFKTRELRSVESDSVSKTMTSSGTSGAQVSRIYLDRQNASNQTRVLAKIVSSLIGKKRLPMLVIDSRAVVKDRSLFSARGAGILGFSMFGNDVEYALDDQMKLDLEKVRGFLRRHAGESILLFGFTFMIWQHFCEALAGSGERVDIANGILIHGGGWKKLLELKISDGAFKKRLAEVAGVKRVVNYYGMIEQTGSIFIECEHGHLHASIFSDILIRKPEDFSECRRGERGLVQLLSLLPTSYPGHSILTEDEGQILGEDDCPCGRLGKYFRIFGRIKDAEVRGCSDTYAAHK
jgi:phenylacetate-coenzyme A ligase PaaK-like adenylate-forming protein